MPVVPDTQRALDRVVALAHRELAFDLVYVAELTPYGEVCRAVAGDAAAFDISLGEQSDVPGVDCSRLSNGDIPAVVSDMRAGRSSSHEPTGYGSWVGSYVGVPVVLSDGTLYGALWGINHEPDHTLGERDVRAMRMLAKLIVPDLDKLRDHQTLRAGILGLIETESLDVAYQPIVDVQTNRCLGVEALARFPEPWARPDRTFAAAADVGLGLELEELVVRQAWNVLPRLADGQFLALNLTPGSLLALARRANQRQEVALSSLVVEITEHTAIDAYADLRIELARLRARGLRVAVDDAGAGYASLRHVLELRPDIIKIDRSLIDGLAADRARRLAVSAFISLALDLGSMVVAEGVESHADLAAARRLGISAAQGYLLGRPSTDPRDLARWIRHPAPQARNRERARRRHTADRAPESAAA